jgi:hypothetical protein
MSKRLRFYKTYADLHRLCDKGWDNRLWYHRANKTVLQLADEFQTPAQRVADVLAITSPRVTVTRNIRSAREYLDGGVYLRIWSSRRTLPCCTMRRRGRSVALRPAGLPSA